MATYTSGTTATNFGSFVESTNSIMTPFKADDFGGFASSNGTTYYAITAVQSNTRLASGTTTRALRFYVGTSAGDNNVVDVSLGNLVHDTNDSSKGIAYAIRSEDVSPAKVITKGTQYYAGPRGAYIQNTRTSTTTGTVGYRGVFHGSVLAGSGVTNASTSQTYFQLTFYGVPGQVAKPTVSSSGSTVTVNWNAPNNGGNTINGYFVQRSTSPTGTFTTMGPTGPTPAYEWTGTTASITESDGTYYYRVAARNGLRDLESAAFGNWSVASDSVTVTGTPAPVFSGSFANGRVGVGYSSAITSNNTNSTSLSASIPGLTASHSASNGTGTYRIGSNTTTQRPTASGTYTVTATATGAGGSTDFEDSVTISAPIAPSFSTTTFAKGKQGSNYTGASITVSNTSGTTNVSLSATSIAGLSISSTASSVTLSGTPNDSGTFSFTATATGYTDDGSANTTAETLRVTIDPLLPPVWSDFSLSGDFRVGQSYVTTSGGNNSISASNSANFSIVAGSLPGGISAARSLSGTTATYTFTGSPQSRSSYNFTVRASNNDGNATPDQNFTGNITHPPLWVDQTLGDFLQGRVYNDVLTVSTSTPITWAITSGSLPAGITSSVSGINSNTFALKDTPTGSGNFSFTISATNGDGSLSKTFSGTIKLVPNWLDDELGSFVETIDYEDSVAATNSPTYAVSSGSLPTGISLNSSTGLVFGTPTVVNQPYDFTIRASNADGFIDQRFTGSVQPDLGGGIKVFSGTWGNKEIYVYDNNAWVLGKIHRFNGNIWVKSLF